MPFTKNSTSATVPSESVAVADNATDAPTDTDEPPAGAVRVTDGGTFGPPPPDGESASITPVRALPAPKVMARVPVAPAATVWSAAPTASHGKVATSARSVIAADGVNPAALAWFCAPYNATSREFADAAATDGNVSVVPSVDANELAATGSEAPR